MESPDVANAVLNEAQKDYDLLMLDASENQGSKEHLFSKTIDSLVSLSPCLTLIVHAAQIPKDWAPHHILVPANGSFAAKRAVEFSFLLASSNHTVVTILNIFEKDKNSWYYDLQSDMLSRQLTAAERMVHELKELGEMQVVFKGSNLCLSVLI